MRDPEEKEFYDGYGNAKKLVIHRFSATDGLRILAQLPTSCIPKLGDYKLTEETILLACKYVGVPGAAPDGKLLMLGNKALVDNHLDDAEMLMSVIQALAYKNYSFFRGGQVSRFFDGLKDQTQELLTQTLSQLWEQFSKKD